MANKSSQDKLKQCSHCLQDFDDNDGESVCSNCKYSGESEDVEEKESGGDENYEKSEEVEEEESEGDEDYEKSEEVEEEESEGDEDYEESENVEEEESEGDGNYEKSEDVEEEESEGDEDYEESEEVEEEESGNDEGYEESENVEEEESGGDEDYEESEEVEEEESGGDEDYEESEEVEEEKSGGNEDYEESEEVEEEESGGDEDYEDNEEATLFPSVICPACGMEFDLENGGSLCPFCGSVVFEDSRDEEAAEESEDEEKAEESRYEEEAEESEDVEEEESGGDEDYEESGNEEKAEESEVDEEDEESEDVEKTGKNILCYGCMQEIMPGAECCPYCGKALSEKSEKCCYLAPGTDLSKRYIVGFVLEDDMYCITYIGLDTQLSRKVIIKEYLPTEYASRDQGDGKVIVNSVEKEQQFSEGKKAFIEEGKKLADCKDVSEIVSIYDVVSENETVYLIMEYLNGETLKARLEREGVLSPREATRIMTPVLQALEVVHGAELLHRNIDPDSIFLCKSGEVKLIHFGTAKYAALHDIQSLSALSNPGFSPVEQYRSEGEQGSWSDVYAAGATLYKMLTGVTPPSSTERLEKDELRNPAGVPEWIWSADRKYRHLKYLLACYLYHTMTGRNPGEAAAEGSDTVQKSPKSERMALSIFSRLTGSAPDAVNYNEECYAAKKKFKSIPKPTYIAMLNALNVDKDDRTQSAQQFRKELTDGTTPVLIKRKNSRLNIGALPRWFKVAGALTTAVVILLVVSVAMFVVDVTTNMVTTPQLINHTTDEAEKMLLNKELEFIIVDSRISDKVTVNRVMGQEPDAMTLVKKDSVVKATVSIGPEKVTVPNFIGMTKDEAIAELKSLRLAYEFDAKYSSVKEGRICLQNTKSDSRIPVGSTVGLVVSLGLEDFDNQEETTVPDLTDLTLEEAKSELEESCLYLSVDSVQYDEKPVGTILSQSKNSGSIVKQGSTIEVVVSRGTATVAVPYVTYKTEREAIKLLKSAKLNYDVTYEFHDFVLKGNVCYQSAKAEDLVTPGTKVDLIVSMGKKTVFMPQTVGKTSEVAASMIEEKGLKVIIREESKDGVDAGKVIKQSPEAKKEVNNGTKVIIYISKGKNRVVVPSVADLPRLEAEQTLKEMSFRVSMEVQFSDTVEQGTVISQSPPSSSYLEKGSRITIIVSKGVQPINVPDVLGKSAESAYYSIVENLELELVMTKEYSSKVGSGFVIRQTPEAGKTVSKGSVVKIVISKGKEPTIMPDVLGKTKEKATKAFEDAGLIPDFKGEYSETVESGKVIAQTPEAGTNLGKGDSVTVTVSKGKQPIAVPDVVGKSATDAELTILSAGFTFNSIEGYSDTVAEGDVIKQMPTGNDTAFRNDTVTVIVSKGKSTWSDWVVSLPPEVSDSSEYEIDDSGREYRYRTITTTVETEENWSDWSDWSEDREEIYDPDTKVEDTKTQYRYFRFVCPYCGDDWFENTTCMSCGEDMYCYGVDNDEYDLIEGVHYMWSDYSVQDYGWWKTTRDRRVYFSRLGTDEYWFYLVDAPDRYNYTRTMYRYSTKKISYLTKTTKGKWSKWSDTPVKSSDTLEVESHKLYRYRIKPVS